MSRYADSHALSVDYRPDWRQRAACRDADPELFFGPEGERRGPDQLAREHQAKAYCHTCAVIDACLLNVLEQEDKPGSYGRHGVRGGLTGDERTAQFGKPHATTRTRPGRQAKGAVG